MSKAMLKTTDLVRVKPVKSAVQRMQELYANGNYTWALRLLGRIARDGALEHWRSVFLINTGQFEEAQDAIQKALALGYAGRIASLAVLHRLTRTNRDWLLTLKTREFENLNDFDRSLLEREIATEHFTRGDIITARQWYERAWRTATQNKDNSSLLPSIGEMLGHVLSLAGKHAQAISIYNEALKQANMQRRATLLLVRAISHVILHQLEQAENDILDAKTFIPTLPTDPGLSARLVYIEGRLLHAKGDLNDALNLFEEAAELGHQATHDVEFYAVLWALTTTIELDRFETVFSSVQNGINPDMGYTLDGADIYQYRAKDFIQRPEKRYQKAWFDFKSALLDVRKPVKQAMEQEENNTRAFVRTASAIEAFEAIGARWEVGAIQLLRAEISLAAAFSNDRHPEQAIQAALRVARELGGTMQYATELRALPRLTAYLECESTPAQFKEFLTGVRLEKQIVVYQDRISIDDEPAYKSSNAARLLRYVALNPRSAWRDLVRDVYPNLNDATARQEFAINRRELLEIGVSVDFSASENTYGAAWGAVSLEVLDVETPED